MSRGRISSVFPARFATFGRRVCQSVLLIHSHYGVADHARLVGRAGVPGDLSQALVAAEGGDLVGRASGLGQGETQADIARLLNVSAPTISCLAAGSPFEHAAVGL